MDDRWITIKKAALLTDRSTHSIKRLVQKHSIPTKASGDRSNSAKLIDYRKLIELLSEDQTVLSVLSSTTPNREPDRYIQLLGENQCKSEEEIKQLKNEIAQLRQENRALQEELKALLRKGDQNRGVIGYLVDQVWRGQK